MRILKILIVIVLPFSSFAQKNKVQGCLESLKRL
jgi:hypothetical protein